MGTVSETFGPERSPSERLVGVTDTKMRKRRLTPKDNNESSERIKKEGKILETKFLHDVLFYKDIKSK